MYPLLKINCKKIEENTRVVCTLAKKHGVSVTAITKCFGGNIQIARALLRGGVSILGDSRIRNLEKLKELDCEKWLIRIPMLSECVQAVRYADVSLNSELSVIRRLNEEAEKQNKIHGILLMVDVGDLREGWFLGDGSQQSENISTLIENSIQDLFCAIEEIQQMKHIQIKGIGMNDTCFGGTIPIVDTYREITALVQKINQKYHLACPVVSGGNSSSYYLMENGQLPDVVTNLRFGEVILFGIESAYYKSIRYLNHESFILEVEIIELKEKPSVPIGLIGMDAFGNIPAFKEKGIRTRAICAIGRQDTSIEHLIPLDSDIIIEGGSSDHMIVDLTNSAKEYAVGDILQFRCDYVSSLHICTSDYIDQIIYS